jgi:CxxC-x17-CxxC domain-containing protein
MPNDTKLTCRDCGKFFTFSVGEQDFYASRGFSEPSRCPDCRAARKAQRDAGSPYSTYASREMFSGTCSSCGQQAQVPFQPSDDKPLYCSTCFDRRRNDSQHWSGGRGRI